MQKLITNQSTGNTECWVLRFKNGASVSPPSRLREHWSGSRREIRAGESREGCHEMLSSSRHDSHCSCELPGAALTCAGMPTNIPSWIREKLSPFASLRHLKIAGRKRCRYIPQCCGHCLSKYPHTRSHTFFWQ